MKNFHAYNARRCFHHVTVSDHYQQDSGCKVIRAPASVVDLCN